MKWGNFTYTTSPHEILRSISQVENLVAVGHVSLHQFVIGQRETGLSGLDHGVDFTRVQLECRTSGIIALVEVSIYPTGIVYGGIRTVQ